MKNGGILNGEEKKIWYFVQTEYIQWHQVCAGQETYGDVLMSLLEVQILETKVSLHNASSLHSAPQNILLCGNVAATGYPVQVIQVAGQRVSRGG